MESSSEVSVSNDSDGITIQELPNEVLLNIFSNFSVPFLCTNIAPVCRRWCELSKDQSLWTVLKFPKDVEIEVILDVLGRAPLLKQLSVRDVVLDFLIVRIALKCKLIEKLSVKNCVTPVFGFMAIFNNCRWIVHLNISQCLVTYDAFDAISSLTNLLTLKMADVKYYYVDDPFWSRDINDNILLPIAKNCTKLKHIDLTGQTAITEGCICELVRERMDSLRTLFVELCTDRSLDEIAKLCQLSRFRVNNATMITDTGLGHLEQCSNLVELGIKIARRVTNNGLVALFSSASMQNLVRLDLSDCTDLNDDGVVAIVNRCNGSISRLSLQGCLKVSDNGVREIVQNCCHLKYLDFSDTRIFGYDLIGVPELLPKLTVLKLEYSHAVDEDVLSEILRKNPGITIIDYFGITFQIGFEIGRIPEFFSSAFNTF